MRFKTSTGEPVNPFILKDEIGVSSYNWISRVTHFPESWTRTELWKDLTFRTNQQGRKEPAVTYDSGAGHWRHADGSPVIAFPVSEGMIDLPPLEPSQDPTTGNINFVYFVGDKKFFWDNVKSDPAVGLPLDKFDYYYGVDGAPFSGSYEISFHDRPLQALGALLPGEYIGVHWI
jgi:hypothetical protein